MRRNLIFLDFDGVIINRESLMKQSGLNANAAPECVRVLNKITERANAAIVISSTWRKCMPVGKLRLLLKKWGVSAPVLGVTPDLRDAQRGKEILKWLADHRGKAKDFVILDDDADMHPFHHKLVKTEFAEGLAEKHIELALARLTL